MNTVEKRLNALEKQVKSLSKLVRSGATQKDDFWLKVMDAAHVLGVSPDTLRRRIREAQAEPEASPYKKGVHWDGEKTYRINVSRWCGASFNYSTKEVEV
jgi:hypothetical protein